MAKLGDKPPPPKDKPSGGKHEKDDEPVCSCMFIRGDRVPDLNCPKHKGS